MPPADENQAVVDDAVPPADEDLAIVDDARDPADGNEERRRDPRQPSQRQSAMVRRSQATRNTRFYNI